MVWIQPYGGGGELATLWNIYGSKMAGISYLLNSKSAFGEDGTPSFVQDKKWNWVTVLVSWVWSKKQLNKSIMDYKQWAISYDKTSILPHKYRLFEYHCKWFSTDHYYLCFTQRWYIKSEQMIQVYGSRLSFHHLFY